jgi:hypothetical protein
MFATPQLKRDGFRSSSPTTPATQSVSRMEKAGIVWHRRRAVRRVPANHRASESHRAAEAVRALHFALADALDDAAEELDRAAVVRALDALARRRARHKARSTDRPKGAAMTGRTAAYACAAFTWAVKPGTVGANPFADSPVAQSIT